MTKGTFSDEGTSTEPPSKVARLDSVETEKEAETDVMDLSRVNSTMFTPEAKFRNQGELFDELMCLFSESIKKTGSYPRKAYSNTIRKFSITMLTYSPKAYE